MAQLSSRNREVLQKCLKFSRMGPAVPFKSVLNPSKKVRIFHKRIEAGKGVSSFEELNFNGALVKVDVVAIITVIIDFKICL